MKKLGEFIKVHFDLEQDDGGYPPVRHEGLWCIQKKTRCIVNNIPVFIPGLSCGDEIAIKEEDGKYVFECRTTTIAL